METDNLRSRTSELDRQLLLTDDSDSDQNVSGYVDDPINDDSDDLVENLFDDDTDNDPTFDPFDDGLIEDTDTANEDDVRPIARPRPRPIPVPAQRRRVISSSESDGDNRDDSEWEEISENNPPNFQHTFDFSEVPGPKRIPPNTTEPIDFFNLFFTTSLLTMIAVQTNKYAEQKMSSFQTPISPRNRFANWFEVTVSEIRAFIIVVLNMGLIRKPTLKAYWSQTSSQATPWFNKMFSRARFENLLAFFHLVDNSKLPNPGQPGYDPCQKFQPFVDHCNNLFQTYYTANQQVSVDESMVGTKCHTSLMQYLPNKHHHRWGVKFWVMCDAVSRYCLKLFCYKGAKSEEDKTEQKQFGLAYTVVKKLFTACNYLKKGYHVFIDNFFVSMGLAKWLYSEETFMTGTCRRDRKGLPNNIKAKKFRVGEKIYFRKGQVVLFGYREKKSQKKPVLLLSTKTKISMEKITKKRCGRIINEEKPSIIADYNQYMGGIDSNDMMLYCYLNERRQVKYWKKVVFNFISRMLLNAFILYKEVCKTKNIKPMGHYQFIVSIIESVGEQWLRETKESQDVVRGNGNNDSGRRGLRKLPGKKEKTCWVCSTKGSGPTRNRKRSRTVCSQCQEGCHAVCFAKHTCK